MPCPALFCFGLLAVPLCLQWGRQRSRCGSRPLFTLVPACLPQMLDEFGLLRSRTRAYLGRSGRVRKSLRLCLSAAAGPLPAPALIHTPASSCCVIRLFACALPNHPSTLPQRHGQAAALPAGAVPPTQHPLLARPPSAGGPAAVAAPASGAGASSSSRYEAIYRAALAQVGASATHSMLCCRCSGSGLLVMPPSPAHVRPS